MKIATVVGARPQFIKAAPVSKILRESGHKEFIIHTGQHYDYEMSRIFFDEMGLPEPDVNLGVGSGTHGEQTGEMLIRIEKVFIAEKPDWVLVYGDTNSTLAGVLAAVKLHIPLAHVEAGLRSYNREMPEEHNRIIADHCSDLLFCPTETAVKNLEKEGFTNVTNRGKLIEYSEYRHTDPYTSPLVVNVGDTMYDAVLYFADIAENSSSILSHLKLRPNGYLLATVHRPYNTDIQENLYNILRAFHEIDEPVVFPVHPRTIKYLDTIETRPAHSKLMIIDSVGYLDMLMLEKNARIILTDSGGVQKEAYFFGVPCLTLRPETEWIETVETGWNTLVGSDTDSIKKSIINVSTGNSIKSLFGNGSAAKSIVKVLSEGIGKSF